MSWARSRPNGGKTADKYREKIHRDQRKAYERQMLRDGFLTCAQGVCKYRSRTILPGMRWCAGHDDTGTVYIGPVHDHCNKSDGGRRANARQRATRLRW